MVLRHKGKYKGFILATNFYDDCLRVIEPYEHGWRVLESFDYPSPGELEKCIILACTLVDNLKSIEHAKA